GYSRTEVNVPAASDASVSQPFFLDDPVKWVMIKGGSHEKANAPYPFEINGDSFIPLAAVRLAGAPRRFAVFVENASPDEITLTTEPAAKVVSQVRTATGAKFVFELGNVTASKLDVKMRKKGSDEERSASVAIRR